MTKTTRLVGASGLTCWILGSILGHFYGFFVFLTLIGLVCVFVAYFRASGELRDPKIKRTFIIAAILYFIGNFWFIAFTISAASHVGRPLGPYQLLHSDPIATFIGVVLYIIASWYWFRASELMTQHTAVGLYKVGGILIVAGSLLMFLDLELFAVVGGIGQVLQIVAFSLGSRVLADARSSVAALSAAMFIAAVKCTEGCRESIEGSYGKDSSESKFMFLRVCYEYLYFFLHITDRIALSDHGPDIRSILQDDLYPLVQQGSTETFCKGWPTAIKEKVNSDFVINVNSANQEYALCKSIYDEKAPLIKTSVVGTLGYRIANVLAMQKDVPLLVACTATGLGALSSLELKKSVATCARSYRAEKQVRGKAESS